MKQERKILSILFLCGFWTTIIQAQETIPATGGNATGNGGSVSYTVGQITYNALPGTNGIVAQGVQRTYEMDSLSPSTYFLKIISGNKEIKTFKIFKN